MSHKCALSRALTSVKVHNRVFKLWAAAVRVTCAYARSYLHRRWGQKHVALSQHVIYKAKGLILRAASDW